METLYRGLGLRRDTGLFTLTGRPMADGVAAVASSDAPLNAVFYEITVTAPAMKGRVVDPIQSSMTVLEVQFKHPETAEQPLIGSLFTQQLAKASQSFQQRFAERFHLDGNKYTERQANLTKIAVSNLLGGLGYFHGSSLVRSLYHPPHSAPVSNWPAPLFTATPSRPMFPRGFLWDEGFHGLVLARWDPVLAMETVGHWLDLMNSEGWIPREQILGPEARARVPDEFVVQDNTVANPPTLTLVVEVRVRLLIGGVPGGLSPRGRRKIVGSAVSSVESFFYIAAHRP